MVRRFILLGFGLGLLLLTAPACNDTTPPNKQPAKQMPNSDTAPAPKPAGGKAG